MADPLSPSYLKHHVPVSAGGQLGANASSFCMAYLEQPVVVALSNGAPTSFSDCLFARQTYENMSDVDLIILIFAFVLLAMQVANELKEEGIISGSQRQSLNAYLAYGDGWPFHHHHLHFSWDWEDGEVFRAQPADQQCGHLTPSAVPGWPEKMHH